MFNNKERQLNKQLNDRFKLLEEIDKNTSQIEIMFNYDNNDIKKYLLEKNSKNHLHKRTKCSKLHSRNSTPNNKSSRTSDTLSQKKTNYINYRDEIDLELIGINLYNKGLDFNANKENKTDMKRNEVYNGMTFKPKISIYSKELLNRDPNKFEERLYNQSGKIMNRSPSKDRNLVKDEISDIKRKISKLNSHNQSSFGHVYPRSPKRIDSDLHNYTPKLNKKSLAIAKRFGSSYNRLTKPNHSKKSFYKTEEDISLSRLQTPRKYSYDKSTLGHSLYQRAVRSISKKKEKVEQNRESIENSCLSYKFKPTINYSSEIRDSFVSNKKCIINQNFFNRHDRYNYKKKANLEGIKNLVNLEHSKTYTFKPEIHKVVMKGENSDLLQKSYQQIIKYSNKLKTYRREKSNTLTSKKSSSIRYKSPLNYSKKFKNNDKSLSPQMSILTLRHLFKTKKFFDNPSFLNDSNEYFNDDLKELDQDKFYEAIEKIKNLI